MSDPFIGEIIMFGGNFAPRGWALCDGQLLSISSHSALFSILGTTYGGDGRTSFGLPDLRGRSPKHAGQGPGLHNVRLGQRGGRETHELNTAEMPSHSHTASLQCETAAATHSNPQGRMLAMTDTSNPIYADPVPIPNRVTFAESIVVSNSGGGQAFSIENPYQGVNFIIALEGVFPSRS